MEFRADLVDGTSGPAAAGAAGLRTYRTELDASTAAMVKWNAATGNAAPARTPSPVVGGAETPKVIAARVAAETKAAAQIAAIAEKGAQARATAEQKANAQIQLAREKMAAADNALRNKSMASLILAQSKAKPGGSSTRAGQPGGASGSTAKPGGVEDAATKNSEAMKSSAMAGMLKGAQARTEAYYEKVRSLDAKTGKAGEAVAAKKAAKDKVFADGAMSAAKGLALAGGAALGAGGALGLARMAMGYKGMMQLQGITYRAQIAFRGLFSGVDPSPIIRAATAFTSNFSKATVTGQALSGLFTRGFNGLFGLIEKATPYITAFTQGIVLGFLYAENAILKARIALVPYEGLLGGIVSSTSMLKVAAIGGGLALGIATVYAVSAAAPFIALGAAIMAVAAAFEQASKLSKEWDENSGSQIWAKLKQDLGGAPTLPKGMVTGADYDKLHANDKAKPVATTGGVEAGKALGAGMVKGMADSEAAVMAGGAKMAGAAIKGVRTEAEIKSPSRKTRRDGVYMGQGMEKGLEDSGPGVQAAAEKNLVPSMDGASPGGSRNGIGSSPSLALSFPNGLVQVTVTGAGDVLAEVMKAAPMLADEITRIIAVQLGIPTEATT